MRYGQYLAGPGYGTNRSLCYYDKEFPNSIEVGWLRN